MENERLSGQIYPIEIKKKKISRKWRKSNTWGATDARIKDRCFHMKVQTGVSR